MIAYNNLHLLTFQASDTRPHFSTCITSLNPHLHGAAKSRTRLRDWTELNWTRLKRFYIIPVSQIFFNWGSERWRNLSKVAQLHTGIWAKVFLTQKLFCWSPWGQPDILMSTEQNLSCFITPWNNRSGFFYVQFSSMRIYYVQGTEHRPLFIFQNTCCPLLLF